MLVDEARRKLDALAMEDVKELARKELLKRDANTLADVCVTLMDREQLSEWAIPSVVSETKKKYGRLDEQALKRSFPELTVDDGKIRISLSRSVDVTNEMYEAGVRLVCEGYSGDDLLMSVWAPIEDDHEASRTDGLREKQEKKS